MIYHWFHTIINFFNRKYGSNITNFGDIGSTCSVRKLENDMKLNKVTKTEFFLLSKNVVTFPKYWSLNTKTGENENGPNFVRDNI